MNMTLTMIAAIASGIIGPGICWGLYKIIGVIAEAKGYREGK